MNHSELLLQPRGKYGITEKKKSELDQLSNRVIDAQDIVEQLQAIVSSLTDKSAKFQAALAVAEANKEQALNNRNLLDQVVQNALNLRDDSAVAFDEMVLADSTTKIMSVQMKDVIDKLIYSAEVVNKLSNLVIRKKALNPLISDDLVSRISTAGKDANNAVALVLVALKSVFAAQASNLESEAATALEYTEAMKLYDVLTGKSVDEDDDDKKHPDSLQKLLHEAYTAAETGYKDAFRANAETIKQLNQANSELSKAQIKLKSLQSGLAAGNAAALAS
jgi:Ribonuclease G/E